MAKTQAAFAEIGPMKCQVEIDARLGAMEAHVLFDRALGRIDARESVCVGAFAPPPRFAGFEIGDLVLARCLEHAIARVPVRLHMDVVEMPMRQAAEHRLSGAGETQRRNSQAAPTIETR